jgi:LuxR family maltose regulon positive regulatory protein
MPERDLPGSHARSGSPQGALLATKLYVPPPRLALVARPRLTGRLTGALRQGHRLTLVSAPAGFGKTTLLSEWVASLGAAKGGAVESVPPGSPVARVAWLSLDGADSDPSRFLAYLIAALQTLDPGLGKGLLDALQSPQPPPPESLLSALVNEMAALGAGCDAGACTWVLILDDYHLIESAPVHSAMRFLLDHLPQQMRLVISSRADPPVNLARLRGRGQLTELRVGDLRFTVEEATAFLNRAMRLDLSVEGVTALEMRTEGWITGLQLAALSLQGQGAEQRANFLQAFAGSDRFVLDYLLEEVLDREAESTRAFLLRTCVLERLSGPLCDAVIQQEGSQAMLERLERDNLFLLPLDNERRWYRYHRLFADILQARLGRESAVALHLRASDWFEQNGFTAEAIAHALAAPAFERAARLIEGSALDMLVRGELTTLLGWLAPLPEDAVRERPWLCVYYAWALGLSGQADLRVEPRLQDAELGMRSGVHSPEEREVIQGHAAAIRAYVAVARDPARAVRLAREALERLPDDELVVRAVVAFTLGGACLFRGDVAGAIDAFAEAKTLGQLAGNIHLAVSALCHQADLRAEQGQLHQASEVYQEALRMATGSSGRPLPVAAQANAGMGALLYEWNDLEAARQQLMTSIELGKQWGNADSLAGDYAALAKVHQAQGDPAAALKTLQDADRLVQGQRMSPLTAARVGAQRARLWLAQGNLAAAVRWAENVGLNAEDNIEYLREPEYLSLARVLTAQGRPGEATTLLARLLDPAERGGRTGRIIEVLALQALAHSAQGDPAQALTSLQQALTLAETEGYVRVFVDEGEPMEALLRAAGLRGIKPRYVAVLLDAIGEETDGGTARTRETGASPVGAASLVEPLSERELEVLRLVAAGLTNQEIADRLVIAVSTVKSHTNHMYGKLGVKNRTQAVARAKALGLLP